MKKKNSDPIFRIGYALLCPHCLPGLCTNTCRQIQAPRFPFSYEKWRHYRQWLSLRFSFKCKKLHTHMHTHACCVLIPFKATCIYFLYFNTFLNYCSLWGWDHQHPSRISVMAAAVSGSASVSDSSHVQEMWRLPLCVCDKLYLYS